MTLPERITAEWLEEHGRSNDVAHLKDKWPDGLPVTLENLECAAQQGFNVWTWGLGLLPQSLTAYDTLMEPATTTFNHAFRDITRSYNEAAAAAIIQVAGEQT